MKTALAILLMWASSGCALVHRPQTDISYSPLWGFRFNDTKDNDVTVDLMEVDPQSKTFHVEGLKIRNNATDPINAFVNQMELQVQYQQQLGQNMSQVLQGLQELVTRLGALVPGTSSGVTISNPDVLTPLSP